MTINSVPSWLIGKARIWYNISMDMAEYMRNLRNKRKELARQFLGNKCVNCGSTENLEFDHIDPNNKEDVLVNLAARSLEKFWQEVVKCQLLCRSCHQEKTNRDNGWGVEHNQNRYSHGCRCNECRESHRLYINAYRQKRRKQDPMYRRKVRSGIAVGTQGGC